jgi:hypothetical protein
MFRSTRLEVVAEKVVNRERGYYPIEYIACYRLINSIPLSFPNNPSQYPHTIPCNIPN